MALIKCPECGRNFSDQADACPDCGYPTPGKKPKKKSNIAGGILAGIFAVIILLVLALIGVVMLASKN